MSQEHMSEDLLEILIGKHIDGEITPAEQRLLEAHLRESPDARALFEQLTSLHARMEQAVSYANAQSTAAEIIVDRAMGRRRSPVGWMGDVRRRFPFAVGLAAGLLIGVAVLLAGQRLGTGSPDGGPRVAGLPAEQERATMLDASEAMGPRRNIEWVSFTDQAGGEWLVEGYRYRTDPRARPCGL
jgi:anti-sigma factor RsiW